MPARKGTRLLATAWLIAAVALVAGGWFAFADEAPSEAGSRYVEGVVGRPSRVNPLFAQPGTVDADLATLLFNGLTRPGPDGAPVNDLAERWDVSADGLRYTFRLRSGLSWHDGRPVTSSDVAFTVAQVQRPGFRGLPSLATEWADVRVETPDERTVTMTLPAPSASFLTRASMGIVPRHLLEGIEPAALAEAPFNRAPVGTGPYRLDSLEEDRAQLEANASYHLGAPALSRLELRFLRDEAALEAALEAGTVTAALLGESAAERTRAAASAAGLGTTELAHAGYTALYLNLQRAPLDDPAVRRAIAAAIDRERLHREALEGRGTTGDDPIVPGSWAYRASERAPEDPSQLLDAAGWVRAGQGPRLRDGRPLSFELVTNADPLRERLAQAIATMLRAQGIEVRVETLPAVQLLQQRLQPRAFDMAIFGWEVGPDPDPYGAWHTSQATGNGRNFSSYVDPEADLLLERARSTLDELDRVALYERFTERFLEQAPAVILHYPSSTFVHPRGVTVSAGLLFDGSSRFLEVHRWTAGGG